MRVEIDGVPYVPTVSATPKWEIEVGLCGDEKHSWLDPIPLQVGGNVKAIITIEFGDGWARVKPTGRAKEIARLLRLFVINLPWLHESNHAVMREAATIIAGPDD